MSLVLHNERNKMETDPVPINWGDCPAIRALLHSFVLFILVGKGHKNSQQEDSEIGSLNPQRIRNSHINIFWDKVPSWEALSILYRYKKSSDSSAAEELASYLMLFHSNF
ncbi:hypothetical protein ACU8KH_01552 [Lachancea thermotolerans]